METRLQELLQPMDIIVSDSNKELLLQYKQYNVMKMDYRNIIDNNGKIPVYEYNNLVAQLFCEKISGKSQNQILKICKSIFILSFPKM